MSKISNCLLPRLQLCEDLPEQIPVLSLGAFEIVKPLTRVSYIKRDSLNDDFQMLCVVTMSLGKPDQLLFIFDDFFKCLFHVLNTLFELCKSLFHGLVHICLPCLSL